MIIRTLDIGADKKADYFGLEREENPAMGYRAIRICLKQPKIFKVQLRAYNPHHKAILKMIRMVVDNAHKCGKWAGICGELGADLALTEEFVRMGVDELSVAPSMIIKIRKIIREIDTSMPEKHYEI